MPELRMNMRIATTPIINPIPQDKTSFSGVRMKPFTREALKILETVEPKDTVFGKVHESLQAKLAKAFETLTERERLVMLCRLGLDESRPVMRTKKIMDIFNLTISHINVLCHNAKTKIIDFDGDLGAKVKKYLSGKHSPVKIKLTPNALQMLKTVKPEDTVFAKMHDSALKGKLVEAFKTFTDVEQAVMLCRLGVNEQCHKKVPNTGVIADMLKISWGGVSKAKRQAEDKLFAFDTNLYDAIQEYYKKARPKVPKEVSDNLRLKHYALAHEYSHITARKLRLGENFSELSELTDAALEHCCTCHQEERKGFKSFLNWTIFGKIIDFKTKTRRFVSLDQPVLNEFGTGRMSLLETIADPNSDFRNAINW